MRFVDVGADHKGMIAFGEPPGKFYAQPVGFLRCDLSGPERLAHMVGDHIICTAHSSGGGNILPLCQQKLCISSAAVTSIAGNQFSVVGLLGICHIVNNIADGTALSPTLADMQRHDACGCHKGDLLSKKETACMVQTAFVILLNRPHRENQNCPRCPLTASEETSSRIVLLPAHELPGAYLSFGSSARKSAPLIISMGDSASGLLSFAPLASPAAKKHRIYRRAPHDLCRKIFH